MDIKKRLYEDFFRPAQYEAYEQVLRSAKEAGYEFHTVHSFEKATAGGKFLILRRDVDTKDLKCMRALLALEKKYDARSSCYFRWNTMDVAVMKEIAVAGGEASYHYEEVASYCYKLRIRSKGELQKHIEEIRDLFIERFAKFKKVTGQPCLTIASHGDYVNRKLHYSNNELIDERVRKECGIEREAYDPEHMNRITCRIADQVERENFTPKAIAAIERGEPVIELLTHPRQWNSPAWINLKEEINRACKGLYMRL